MEACVEALYSADGTTPKRKTLEMIRILKGAISVSKSRTGDVVYRYNRHEKKALSQLLAKYDRDSARSQVTIDSRKRDVLRKWKLVFGRQRAICESLRAFDAMLEEAIASSHLIRTQEEDNVGVQESLPEEENEETENEVNDDETEEKQEKTEAMAPRLDQKSNASTSYAIPPMPVVLPRLYLGGTLLNGAGQSEEQERARRERELEEERARKQQARGLPPFDWQLMTMYLNDQKHLHQDLLTRNALLKIQSSVSKDHVFFKYLTKTRLPDKASALVQNVERDRSLSVDTFRARLTARHGAVRPSFLQASEGSRQYTGRRRRVGRDEGEGFVVGSLDASPFVTTSPRNHETEALPRIAGTKTVRFSNDPHRPDSNSPMNARQKN